MKDRFRSDSNAPEQALNTAIANADIGAWFEKYFEIFDAFYADAITVSTDQKEEPIQGRANVRGLLFNFLVPLHVMAEIGGLGVSVRANPIVGDAPNDAF